MPIFIQLVKKNKTIKGFVERQLTEELENGISPFQHGLSFQIASFFHLDIGGVLKGYVQDFLIDLRDNHSAEEQEIYWNSINHAVRTQERGTVQLPAKLERQFPETFAEALKYYGVR